MNAIEASSVNMRTLADGTLRIQCDVEPRFAQAAFNAFGSPGTAMALAALKPASTPAEPPPAADKRPIGAVCRWLVMRCREPEFIEWLGAGSPLGAAERVREICEVDSRNYIDGNEKAEALYHKKIRGPYSKFLASRGAT